MRKSYSNIICLFASLAASMILYLNACADETKRLEPNQLFYSGNHDYEKRDYAKALEEYTDILKAGVFSGNLYYNIGNTFLKLGKTGPAILYYEKAQRLMPQDSDLKSNLAYARSVAGESATSRNPALSAAILKIIKSPFTDFNINAIALSAAIIYLILVSIQTLFITSPVLKQKFRFFFPILLILFLLNLAAFGLRYYDEKILKSGVVMQKEVECKYEPIDASTTYYTLHEGEDIFIIKDRDGWCQIRRADGKVGWVKKESIEEV